MVVSVLRLGGGEALALGALAVLLGLWMRRIAPALVRWSIPAAVAGGLAIAAVLAGMRGRVLDVEIDGALRDLLQLICFTIIGLNASLRVIVRGGVAVPVLLLLAGVGAALQNVIGAALAWVMGLNPLVGVLAGSVSLNGGPATSLAFGAVFEKEGVRGAASLAVASATFGIAVAGLLAGRIGQYLVDRRGSGSGDAAVGAGAVPVRESAVREVGLGDGMIVLQHVLAVCLCVGLGSAVSHLLRLGGLTVPAFIGPMTVAAVWRNVNDRVGWQELSETTLRELFQIALPLFIGVAIASLKLWELTALAAPLLVILLVQTLGVAVMSLGAYEVLRRVTAARYEAAVMTAGYAGFMLGITPNAMASMEELTSRNGPAPQAFLTVPMVGGYLNDFVNSLVITASAAVLRSLLH